MNRYKLPLITVAAAVILAALLGFLASRCLTEAPEIAQDECGETVTGAMRGTLDLTPVRYYTDFFDQVYKKMNSEYYLDVSRERYENFLEYFKEDFLPEEVAAGNDRDKIKHNAAALLVRELRGPEDIVTRFFNPKKAERFEKKALGYSPGLGISGRCSDTGFIVTKVEARSDAYGKGLRPDDIILTIDGENVTKMDDERLKIKLYPPLETKVIIDVLFHATGKAGPLSLDAIKFFKEMVLFRSTGIPGMYYIKISQFNLKTAEDTAKIADYLMSKGMESLVIDVRNNGGGPPLAVCDTLGLFLPVGTQLMYFQRKNKPINLLVAPESRVKYTGKLAVLINDKSKSAAELFAGTLRSFNRAVLIGDKTAGVTYLKNMAYFEDKSMLLLITSLAYLHNGQQFDTLGILPDYRAPNNTNIFPFVELCFKTREE